MDILMVTAMEVMDMEDTVSAGTIPENQSSCLNSPLLQLLGGKEFLFKIYWDISYQFFFFPCRRASFKGEAEFRGGRKGRRGITEKKGRSHSI